MKKKRAQSASQKKALKRNWSKGIITGMVKHCNGLKRSKAISFQEQMKILKCKTILEELLTAWKPTL